MKFTARAVIAVLTLVGAAAAQSAVIRYEGVITSAAPTVTSSVGGFGFVRQVASDVDFWSFAGIAGGRVSIRGTRLDSGLDPALDLYFGTTTADESLFRTGQSWGGLQFLASADDEVESLTGPFGDPLLTSFTLPSTGTYTIAIGGAGSEGEGPYRYSLSVLAAPIPEPETWAMFLMGSCLLGGWLRRRDTTVATI
jgi:hypothetical protein